MPYCEPDDVKRVLTGAETDEDGRSAADLGDEQIQLEIDNAQAQIDGVLSGTYRVPFGAPVPQLIVSINIDIAAYLSDLNYRKGREYESDNYPIIRRYNRAREMLEWLRTGIMKVPVPENTDPLENSHVIHAYPADTLITLDDVFGNSYRDW